MGRSQNVGHLHVLLILSVFVLLALILLSRDMACYIHNRPLREKACLLVEEARLLLHVSVITPSIISRRHSISNSLLEIESDLWANGPISGHMLNSEAWTFAVMWD